MRSPDWDPDFATSGVHGEVAQRSLLQQTVQHCKQRRLAVDVGAHIGLWTKNLASQFQRVYAFEPTRENYDCLRVNLAGLKNVQVFHRALGAEGAECSMALPTGGNSGCWHVAPGLEVLMSSLDMFGLETVDLIKLDVEGYEGAVLRGAFETIRASKPVVVFEDNGVGPRYFGADWDDPKPILASLGYMRRLRWRKDEVWLPV